MKLLTGIISFLFSFTSLQAQTTLQHKVTDAFVITRMTDKFHLQPKPIDATFSAAVFNGLLKTLDEERIFFTKEDIATLSGYQYKLHEEVLGRKTDFLQLLASVYELRLKSADTMIDRICRTPFDFTVNEKLTVAEDTSYALHHSALATKLRKLLKASVLDALTEDAADQKVMDAVAMKKRTDSLEVIFRKKVAAALKRSIQKDLETPGGIAQLVGESYCETIAAYHDPHTNYLSLTNKENLESELGEKSMMFGFTLDEDAGGQVIISRLKPGSPAYQSGQLNESDHILAIQWQGKSAIDVRDADLSEVAEIVSGSNHDKAIFTVQKADGSKREVELTKAKLEDDSDEGRVKSFVLKGKRTIGYISLPAFYRDWDNQASNVNGCANDVAKEILKLKKENIEGLVLDLRFNGGGAVDEAVELAGIFIDVGPVAMEKDRNAKVYTLKDVNRGTMYDGPLFIMVNGFSASASELVAGTLQDYNRAVIVGSTTYGKATSQVIFPMDTTVRLDKDFSNVNTSSYIKITLDKLYRITGKTAQFAGVTPDVLLPDPNDADPQRESTEPFALPATGIEANKFFKPMAPLAKQGLQEYARSIMDTTAFFKAMATYINQKKNDLVQKDIPLHWKEALQQKQQARATESPSYNMSRSFVFTVGNHQYEQQRLATNALQQEINETWRNFLQKDPYLQVTYLLMERFISKP